MLVRWRQVASRTVEHSSSGLRYYVVGPLRGWGTLVNVRVMMQPTTRQQVRTGWGMTMSSAETEENFRAATRLVDRGGAILPGLPPGTHEFWFNIVMGMHVFDIPSAVPLVGGPWWMIFLISCVMPELFWYTHWVTVEGGFAPEGEEDRYPRAK